MSLEQQIKYISNLTFYIKFNFTNKIYDNNNIKYNILGKNLNNLPLRIKWLYSENINCNITPQIIFLDCKMYDCHNLPRMLEFIFLNNTLPKELINNNYNITKIKFLYFYKEIIKYYNMNILP